MYILESEMSLTHEEAHCSPYHSFVVVLKKQFLQKKISPFALNFEHHNFADVVYPQTATLHTN